MAKDFFQKEDKQKIVDAIRHAELNTSGEIRVHIESSCPENVLDRAAHLFELLKMHKTGPRNGVLFYLAHADRKFAILGDTGINSKVGPGFWDGIKSEMTELFMKGEFASGLEKGITMAGDKLKAHFPYHADDKNELNDEISFGQ